MKSLLSFLTLLLMGSASSNLYAQYAQWPPFGQFALSEEQLRYKEEMRKNKVASQHRSDGNCTGSNTYWLEGTTKYDTRGNLTYSSSSSTYDSRGKQMTYKYDDKDNIIEEADYGQVQKTVEYGYDAAGRLTKRKIHEYGYFDAEPHWRLTGWEGDDEFTLNDKGKVLEHTSNDGRTTYKYNAAGDEVEHAWFKLDGSLASKVVSTYDQAGHNTEEEVHDSTGLLIGKSIYAYDKGGRRTKEEKYDASGRLSSSTADTYDEAGHKTKEEKYDSGGRLSGNSFSRTIDIYDQAGHKTREDGYEGYDSGEHLSSIALYTYDEPGRETKEEFYGLDGKTSKGATTFKYDPRGLLIQKSDSRPNGRCMIYTYQFYP
jgi:YD repeat-containing protein